MGRRTRKRSVGPEARREATPVPAPAARAPAAPMRRRARLDEAPRPPWHPVPLVELCILAGLVLLVLGVAIGGSRRGAMLLGGLALVSVAGLELALREHFAGYRSHTLLLAGACAVLVDVPLFFTALAQEVLLAVGVAVFALAAWRLRAAFRRRTGGLGFRA